MLPLLAGLAILVGGALIVAFWDDIVNWLKDFIPKVAQFFRDLPKKIAHAAAMFIERVENGLAAIRHKLYYKEEGQWVKETTTRKVKEDEIPPHIRRKISMQEEEITQEMSEELQMEI